MVVRYDTQTDVISIKFSDNKVAESDEEKQGIILDYDEPGEIVGMELIEASKKTNQSNSIVYEVA